MWLGKIGRADVHMVATASGLKWTRTIRTPGLGRFKASSLVGKFPIVPLPPALAPEIRAEEKKMVREEKLRKKENEARLKGDEARGEKRQAGADEESSKEGENPDMSEYTPAHR